MLARACNHSHWMRAGARLTVGWAHMRRQLQHYHTPVMRDICLDHLHVKPGGVYVDCTMGGGGHSQEILRRGGRVIAIDQDAEAIAHTSASPGCAPFIQSGHMEIFHTNFSQIQSVIESSRMLSESASAATATSTSASSSHPSSHRAVDGVLMDLGVSSHQIDTATRGFAFGSQGPLDMRMSPAPAPTVTDPQAQAQGEGSGPIFTNAAGASVSDNASIHKVLTAAHIVNTWSVGDIADVLYEFGDETNSRAIAKQIVLSRPLLHTKHLEAAISSVTPWKRRSASLARCFQALRIVLNDEMTVLEEALAAMHGCIRPGGRLVVLSYHSLEDRRVKLLMRNRANWDSLFKKGTSPSDEEVRGNSRARSAKLRVATRRG